MSGVRWDSLCLISLATPFVQKLVEVYKKEVIEAPHQWLFVNDIHQPIHTKKGQYAESVSLSRCHKTSRNLTLLNIDRAHNLIWKYAWLCPIYTTEVRIVFPNAMHLVTVKSDPTKLKEFACKFALLKLHICNAYKTFKSSSRHLTCYNVSKKIVDKIASSYFGFCMRCRVISVLFVMKFC